MTSQRKPLATIDEPAVNPPATIDAAPAPFSPVMSEELDETRFRPAQVKIMQPGSPDVVNQDATAGVYASPAIGELGEEIVVVPLQSGRFRIMNNPDKPFGENEIVCSASDANWGYTNPDSDYENIGMAGGDCNSCPFAQFTKDPKTGRRNAPLCTLNRTYACYLPEEELIGQLTFFKTSAPAGEDIMSLARQKGGFGEAAFRLKLRFTKKGQFSYYVPMVRVMPVQEDWKEAIQEVLGLIRGEVGEKMAAEAVADAS